MEKPNSNNPQNTFSLPALEQEVLDFWRENKIFDKVVSERETAEPFVFYDGPPFANGTPHYGHITQMAFKDVVLRFKTMQGFKVPRKIGWDTHGLPVEYQLEKELNLSGKKAIEEYGVDKFVEAARSSVLRYTHEWQSTMERMGRWMDLSHPYTTMDRSYIESVWWAFSELHKKGLVYEDYRVGPYCPRCGTVLSNFEVNLGYQDNVADPSVYLKLKVKDTDSDFDGSYLLVWTTTPWTLPVNLAVAVDPKATYVLVDVAGERLVIAKERVTAVFGPDAQIIKEFESENLIGAQYTPLYGGIDVERKVVAGHHVSLEDGTGLVHMAPAHGEDDYKIGKQAGLPVVSSVEADGTIKKGLNWPGEGLFYKQADKEILADLASRNILFKQETIKHTYPFCWRCDTPLLYYPLTSWYVATTKIKNQLITENQKINWQPSHIKEGRFGKWLDGVRDWAISRNRFWGAPIPVWKCKEGHVKVLSSAADLTIDDLHRPYIDNVILSCDTCGELMHREPFVFDCWFESGSMPFAQFGYPHVPDAPFDADIDRNYPADFIVEALDQTRGWFYTLHVLGVALFGKRAFKNVDVNGLILASDGKKLSKKLRNFTEPELLFDSEGVDAFRLFVLTATTIGEDYRFSDDAVRDVKRRWITPLLNVIKYYEQSLRDQNHATETLPHHALLDSWVKAKVAQARSEVAAAIEGDERNAPYDLVKACRTFGPLIEELSTWYVRLSRGRTDAAFCDTLQQVLIKISTTYAPFMPFVMEYLYQKIARRDGFPESVHLCTLKPLVDWHNDTIISNMADVQSWVSLGRDMRAKAKIPNRQPLAKATLTHTLSPELEAILKQELNIKAIEYKQSAEEGKGFELDQTITEELRAEGQANELRRIIQDLRKQAGLTVQDLAYVTINLLDIRIKELLLPQLRQTELVETGMGEVIAESTENDWQIRLYRA